MTIIEAMIALTVLAGGMLAVTTLAVQLQTIRRGSNIARSALTLRTALVDSVQSSIGWRKTVIWPGGPDDPGGNINLACLRPGAVGDCTGAGGPIAVINASENILFNSLRPTTGVTESGEGCNTFVAPPGAPDDNCIMRYDLSWRAICPAAGVCDNPEIEVSGVLVANLPSEKFGPFNPATYNFVTVRGLLPNSLLNACASLGGTFDPITKSCTLPYTGNCPPGQFAVGISGTPATIHQKVCRPLIQRCPAGNLMSGINADGSPICIASCLVPVIPPPPPPPPPPTTPTPLDGGGGTWTDGGGDGGGGGGSDGCDGGGGDGC